MHRPAMFLMCIAALSVAGCNKNGAVEVHPVSGQVIYDGKPAAGVQVFFFPTEAPAIPQIPANPQGITGPGGEFTLTTYKDGDGAAEGKYRVILIWPAEPKEGDDPEMREDRLMGWYDAAHTTFDVSVESGPNQLTPFKLSRVTGPPPVSQGIPGRN